MAKWKVLLEDGREMQVFAPSELEAKRQARHQETTRIEICAKRGQPVTVPFAGPLSAGKVKD